MKHSSHDHRPLPARSLALGMAAAGALSLLGGTAVAATPPCDRACLGKTLDQYLDAVVRHDPSAAPLASGYRATENAAVVKAGDGLWKSATRLGAVQRRYFDPVTGQAAYYGLIEEPASTSVAIIRIRVEGGKVAESETIIARKGDAMHSAEGVIADAPPQGPLPPAERATRDQLRAAADSYFSGIEQKKDELVIKQDGCVRVESGTKVTQRKPPAPQPGQNTNAVEFDSGDCAEGLSRMTQIDKVSLRRYPLLDEEAGVALGFALFTRPPGAKRQNGELWPRNLLSEVFTTRQGKITGIYAAMHYLEPDRPSVTGW